MKRFLLALTFVTSSAFAQTAADLIADFKSMIPKSGITPVTEQAFCYEDQDGVQGYQVDKLQRIASVTKLFSTYLATETLDLSKRFETTLYIAGDRLHIAGSRDPYFEEEKLLLLMAALNDLGYKSFKTVTFDSNFKFYDIALSAHANINASNTKTRLTAYLSHKNKTLIKQKWAATVKFAEEEGIALDATMIPSLQASVVSLSEKNPLLNSAPAIFVHRSRPLHQIIKSMNVMSKNHVAQNLYLEGSRVKSLDALLVEKGLDRKSFKIYNGSGLPIKTSQSRTDNLASCRAVLKLMSLLKESVKKHKLTLSDLVAVNGGKDLGSFRERFLDFPETHEAVISKTGTLMHASTLAGVLMIGEEMPFAILNQTTKIANAKKFQDSFISRMFHHLGEPTPIDYTKISIFPWDGSDFLELRN